jgi:GT2 family glycosyltransferase
MDKSIVVAISAFKSDQAVIDLLSSIFRDPHDSVLQVIVVDSLGSGEISSACSSNSWPVTYYNFNTNLGSAGNLRKRIELASELGAEWCLCLNHDANWNSERLSAMIETSHSQVGIGAVYPVLDHHPRRPRWEVGRRSFTPTAGARLDKIPLVDSSEVLWSSSNGALYSTAPVLNGVEVMSELWMGYEDLAYGVALNQQGWTQLVCCKAVLSKVFDYTEPNLPIRRVFIQDKPAWYSYYNMRNLILINKRYGEHGVSLIMVFIKFIHSGARIVFLEPNRFSKIYLHFRGFIDGFRGRVGKADWP